jgi:hypothetical protein
MVNNPIGGTVIRLWLVAATAVIGCVGIGDGMVSSHATVLPTPNYHRSGRGCEGEFASPMMWGRGSVSMHVSDTCVVTMQLQHGAAVVGAPPPPDWVNKDGTVNVKRYNADCVPIWSATAPGHIAVTSDGKRKCSRLESPPVAGAGSVPPPVGVGPPVP